MKKNILFATVIAILAMVAGCKIPPKEIVEREERTITVTGSAEMEITPDEIYFVIGIKEYCEEEFEDDYYYWYYYDDCKEKVSIDTIENELFAKLKELGIEKENITVEDVGNYWRWYGQEFRIHKKLMIRLATMDEINNLLKNIDMKGVDYMWIDELSHSQIEEFRKDVKKQALIAAKEKAGYLVEAVDKELGDIINITEIADDTNSDLVYRDGSYSNRDLYNFSNTATESTVQGESSIKTISLRFEIKATFEIADSE